MKYFYLLCLTSCFQSNEPALVQGPSVKKQKQKIAVLQKKLQGAEKEQQKVQGELEKLSLEMESAQLALIRRQLDEYEQQGDFPLNLFEGEREVLYRMMQGGSASMALEAQLELDRILRIITEVSDEKKNI